MKESHTHPIKPTSNRNEVSSRVLEVWLELRDIVKNEEAWYILQKFEDDIKEVALETNASHFIAGPSCGCHFDGGALVICALHSDQIRDVEENRKAV